VLAPYQARLREELEQHEGTVEKLLGNAVMARCGTPAAREDDPERAVRAALAIRTWVTDEQAERNVPLLVVATARPELLPARRSRLACRDNQRAISSAAALCHS